MRKVAILCSALAIAGVLASSASAAPPVKFSFSVTDIPATLSGVCPFDVAVSSDVTGFELDFFDRSGAVIAFDDHTVEQDTFSANGKSITGEPYTFSAHGIVDSTGAVTHVYATGVAQRIVLPDGTFFLSAGWVDFANHPGQSFLLFPDRGNQGDVAAFCAALS